MLCLYVQPNLYIRYEFGCEKHTSKLSLTKYFCVLYNEQYFFTEIIESLEDISVGIKCIWNLLN